jgi:hypothetical protein
VSSIHLLPLLSAAIIVTFATLVFRRFALRRSPHLLVWGIGLLLYGLASVAEALSTAVWSPLAFRVWYLAGAVLSAAWIGQGTVHLLAGLRPSGRVGPARGRPRSSQALAAALTVMLCAASTWAASVVFTLPLDASGFDPARPLSAQYRQILPPDAAVRRLTPVFNIYGTLTLAGGALYSAWLLRRRAILAHRVAGNVLIAAGAMVIASAGAMIRLGLGDILYLAEVLAASLMFAGFLLATGWAPLRESAEGARA